MSNIPEWVKYIACDDDGCVYGYELPPKKDEKKGVWVIPPCDFGAYISLKAEGVLECVKWSDEEPTIYIKEKNVRDSYRGVDLKFKTLGIAFKTHQEKSERV